MTIADFPAYDVRGVWKVRDMGFNAMIVGTGLLDVCVRDRVPPTAVIKAMLSKVRAPPRPKARPPGSRTVPRAYYMPSRPTRRGASSTASGCRRAVWRARRSTLAPSPCRPACARPVSPVQAERPALGRREAGSDAPRCIDDEACPVGGCIHGLRPYQHSTCDSAPG